MRNSKKIKYYEAVGRRKESTARVRLYILSPRKSEILVKNMLFPAGVKIKKGEIIINKKKADEYFPLKTQQLKYREPLVLCDSVDRFAISIVIKGGGKLGQLDAVRHGLARALEKVDKEKYRPVLKKAGLLKRDPRVKERRKVGTGGKARRKKQSPKR